VIADLLPLLIDSVADVRAAAVYSIGCFLSARFDDETAVIFFSILSCYRDGSYIVRREVALFLRKCVNDAWVESAMNYLTAPRKHRGRENVQLFRIEDLMWRTALALSVDPVENVYDVIKDIVDEVSTNVIRRLREKIFSFIKTTRMTIVTKPESVDLTNYFDKCRLYFRKSRLRVLHLLLYALIQYLGRRGWERNGFEGM
jgi:hypothetical protein